VKPPLALRMAAREARAAGPKFLFVVVAVAAGVAALTGVRGFSQSFRAALLRESRTLMAADVSVRAFATATPEQQSALDGFAARGVAITPVTETVSMMTSPRVAHPVLVSIKAVDPGLYPFYGALQLDPPVPLREALTGSTIAVSDDLLLRLAAQTGDTVKVGSAEFRIAAVVRLEPDRMTGSLNVGPRILMTRQGLDRTGLMQFGSRASYRWLLRLGPGAPEVQEVHDGLERAFRRAGRVANYNQVHPSISRGLDQSTTFLTLVSLLALVVGGLGVAAAIHSHLQQRMDSIGILKCLGARSGQIIRVYMFQALALGLAGSGLGILAGYGVQAVFPRLLQDYFQLSIEMRWVGRAALEGLAAGMLITLLFTLPPLLMVRQIRPADVFRRDMAEARPAWRQRLKRAWASIAAGALILAALGGMAAWLAGSRRIGLEFVAEVAGTLAILSAVAWALLRLLRVLPRLLPWRMPAAWRHGIANLYRPGNHAAAVLVAMGLGVTFTLTVYLVQRSVLVQIVRNAPPDAPNVFFLNITDRERDGIHQMVRSHPGVEDGPPPVAAYSARLVSINGVAIEQLGLQGWGRRFTGPRYVTWSERAHKNAEVLEGAWWTGRPAAPEVAVEEDAAQALGARLGTRLEWQIGIRKVTARVAAVYRGELARTGSSMEFLFSPGALEGLPAVYFAAARIRAREVPALQKKVFERYPTITVINAADVLQIVQQVIDQIALVVRFISAFAILGGVVILAAGVAGTRFRRVREVTILKTLGATRSRVVRIFSVEFLILGTVAGLMGSLLAAGLAGLLLRRTMQTPVVVDWPASVVAVLLTALLANAAGWGASFRILGHKPLEILRHE